MRYFSTVFRVLPVFCALMSCGDPVVNMDLLPMRVIGFSIYTTEIQEDIHPDVPSTVPTFSIYTTEGFQQPHYAVFAIVHCEIQGGDMGSGYTTEHVLPADTFAYTFAGEPIYTDGDTIGIKMTEHRPTDVDGIGILDVAELHREVVFIGFCGEGDYRLNVNGVEKPFRVGNRTPTAIENDADSPE